MREYEQNLEANLIDLHARVHRCLTITVCLTINHPKNLDNIFIPKTLEKQCAKNKAVKKDIDEWICRAESME